MRAVVFTAEGPRVSEVPEPHPGPGQVLLRVEYCGICGSDLHAAEPDFRIGVTMGHEFVGTIVEAGAEASSWRPGQRVVVNPNGNWCGACANCARGETNLCPELWRDVPGLTTDGGLAPYAAVSARLLRAVPDGLEARTAAWVEPTAVALRAVRRSGLSVGQSAVVFGAGPIGLLVTSVLAAAGASGIVVVDRNAGKRELASRLGATAVIDPTATDVVASIAGLGDAPPFAFDCSGSPAAYRDALRVLRPNGRLTVVGLSRRPPELSAPDLVYKELEIRASFIYREEFDEAIGLLASGSIPVDELTTAVIPVGDVERLFAELAVSHAGIKYLVSAHHPETRIG